MLRAPFPYYGSKIEAAPLIESLMGSDAVNLVIPFAGSLGELLGRSAPAKIETVNDIDGLIVNAWRGLAYHAEEMADLCDHPVHEVTLHAAHDELVRRREELLELVRSSSPRACDVELAAWWVSGRSCWLGGGWCEAREAASAGSTRLRITLCGKNDEHDELLVHGWTRHQWRNDGEVIWASPRCQPSRQGQLFAMETSR